MSADRPARLFVEAAERMLDAAGWSHVRRYRSLGGGYDAILVAADIDSRATVLPAVDGFVLVSDILPLIREQCP